MLLQVPVSSKSPACASQVSRHRLEDMAARPVFRLWRRIETSLRVIVMGGGCGGQCFVISQKIEKVN